MTGVFLATAPAVRDHPCESLIAVSITARFLLPAEIQGEAVSADIIPARVLNETTRSPLTFTHIFPFLALVAITLRNNVCALCVRKAPADRI